MRGLCLLRALLLKLGSYQRLGLEFCECLDVRAVILKRLWLGLFRIGRRFFWLRCFRDPSPIGCFPLCLVPLARDLVDTILQFRLELAFLVAFLSFVRRLGSRDLCRRFCFLGLRYRFRFWVLQGFQDRDIRPLDNFDFGCFLRAH